MSSLLPKNNFKISVVIPTYNAAKYIGEAIKSVLHQTYDNFEIIVVDDGSVDDTQAVLKKYIEKGQIKYLHQENKGPGAARNRGVRNTSGEFVAFLDADDVWLPQKLERQMPLFENRHTGLVYADMEFFGGPFRFRRYSEMTDCFYRGEALRELIRRNFISMSSVVLRRAVFDTAGYFSEDFKRFPIGEDYELWLRIASRFPIDFVPEPLVRYRIHGEQMSQGRGKNYKTLASIYKKLLSDENFKPYRRLVFKKYFEERMKLIASRLLHL